MVVIYKLNFGNVMIKFDHSTSARSNHSYAPYGDAYVRLRCALNAHHAAMQ